VNSRIAVNTYRLRKLAMGMGVFTVGDLAVAAGVSKQTVHDFLGSVREKNPGSLTVEELTSLKPGRRVQRYTLTPEGFADLATANSPFAREINEEAFQKDPALQTKSVTVPRPVWPWKQRIDSWLDRILPEYRTAIDQGAWAVLIKPGEAGAARFGGRICSSLTEHSWTLGEVENAVLDVFNPLQQERLEKQGWTAYAHFSEKHEPVELYARLAGGQPVIELRFLPKQVPTLEDLHLPQLVDSLSSQKTGLILVTGLAGSGRSGTIAAMIGSINSRKSGHITTIDEPIRYVHASHKSFVQQRQIAIDTPDFSPALEQALGDSSTVVAVSDVPDQESLSTILAAADRTLLVCRVAAPSPSDAIRKLVKLVPESERAGARTRLAESLSGIICMVSVPDASGTGMVVETEVLGWRKEAGEAIVNPEKSTLLVEELMKAQGPVERASASVRRVHGKDSIPSDTAEQSEMFERKLTSHI
jgi:twitching motility protein PilT